MQLLERKHVPDILECLAQLSSDEVPTPPKLANAMLDLLPNEVWTTPDYRWCDPCSKSGVFLREIAKRLLFEGLVDKVSRDIVAFDVRDAAPAAKRYRFFQTVR